MSLQEGFEGAIMAVLSEHGYLPDSENAGTSGRPRVDVDIEDIEFLRGLRLSYTKIASFLGVSRSTIYRRLEEYGVSLDSKYTEMSDSDLDRQISLIKIQHPNDGERLMIAHLASRGIILPRTRIRASIHRVDPENTAIRRSITVRRRVYHVDGPNSLWHLDGHHKLIRWRLVTHGGIDGYSRTIVYLSCSDNNRACTALHSFIGAVSNYGLPERIRTDHGGENIRIWEYMIDQHNTSSVVITGSSTHNERIERLWRDVYRCVAVLYHDLFRQLEDENRLDPLNEVDLYCLHYVFIPKINATLTAFQESWNNHSVSTEHNLTPNQLFIRGAIENNIVPCIPPSQVTSTVTAPTSSNNHVEVPRISFSPCSGLLRHINSRINPLSICDDLGHDLYETLVSIVGQHLSRGCQLCT